MGAKPRHESTAAWPFEEQKAARIGRSAIIPYENRLAAKVASVTPFALHQRLPLHVEADTPIGKKGATGFKDPRPR